jgi:mRNA-decapping enzyme subunit 2
VCGAVMLNDVCSRCVLVKGWSQRSGWYEPRIRHAGSLPIQHTRIVKPCNQSASAALVRGFPKGKINKDEAELDCAVREVQEETGFNCRQSRTAVLISQRLG